MDVMGRMDGERMTEVVCKVRGRRRRPEVRKRGSVGELCRDRCKEEASCIHNGGERAISPAREEDPTAPVAWQSVRTLGWGAGYLG